MFKDLLVRAVFFVCSGLLIGSGSAFGQERNVPMPSVDIPTKLEPYADLALVQTNARRAIELLATAELKLAPYPEGRKQITPECDSAEVRSFNRGYLLAHAGFNIFLSLQELGIPRVEGPNGGSTEMRRSFVQFGRGALLSVWTPSRLKDLLKVRQALSGLPQPIRQDLAAFLSKLVEYRQHYARLKKARAAAVDELFLREDGEYYWYLAYLERSNTPEARETATVQSAGETLKKVLKGIGYDELSDLLDQQAREVSDVAKADPGRCFIEHHGPTITLPSEKLEYDGQWIYPTKYLISFWRRRDMEGTSNIAAHVIAEVLETLREDAKTSR
jgi:hypothetical protein